MPPTTSTFAFLFPGNAMTNSLLATSYISIIPNVLLYFVPPDIKPTTLNVLVNFAVGSLLGDVFLHLLPHAYNNHSHSHRQQQGKNDTEHLHSVNDEHKNLLLGVGIFAGIFFFYAADKLMRAFYGNSGHDHSHHAHGDHHVHEEKPHAHTHQKNQGSIDNKKSNELVVDQVAVREKNEGLRQRGTATMESTKAQEKEEETVVKDDVNVRASAYLNLLADFTHNLTDGIAMAASFYASPAIGATTAVAVFFHEIPHEVSDYAILLKSGFSKQRAMMAQFTTAIGAYIGTLIGIFIEEMANKSTAANDTHQHHHHRGLFGTSMTWGDLIIPATAGGFLYIATVGVIPELLENKHNASSKLQPFKELFAMVFGVALMAGIALNESDHH